MPNAKIDYFRCKRKRKGAINLNRPMPSDYKYELITKGRLKAIQLAWNEANELHKDLAKSGVVASGIIERVRLLRALVARGVGCPLEKDEIELLEKVLGKHMGEEKKK